ncbi:MAG: S41 family peptidase [Candidatus Margulisiibacteriota bacterium]
MSGITINPISDFISIKINQFDSTITSKTLTQLNQYPPTPNLMIDLRDNFGGHLYDALTFGALFVTKNKLIELVSKDKKTIITRPENHPWIATKQLIILVNETTASAAEACAHVLSAHPNALIIGTNTLGKTAIKSSQAPSHTHFLLPNHHIVPDIFHRFNSHSDYQTSYLTAIQLAN